MSLTLMQAAAEHVAQFEGYVAHVYLDSVGVPTIAYGYNLSFAKNKARVARLSDWQLAALENDIHACKAYAQAVGHFNIVATAYAQHTSLRLQQDVGLALMARSLTDFVERLSAKGFDVKRYPQPAALAVIDMAYNLGVTGLLRKFPRFCRSVSQQNWAAAAQESARRGISDARNAATYELLKQSV